MSKTSMSVGVPGIPTAALNAISDENTRLVLESIVNGLNVRNGFTGNGESAFLTKGELSSQGAVGNLVINALQSANGGNGGITPGQVPLIINALQAQISETRLFKDLGDKIVAIDGLTNGYKEVVETAVNDVASVTRKAEQIASTIGDIYAILGIEAETRVDANGTVYGQYFVKIDANRRIAGFGLANDGKVSDFIVRADKFAIASPSGKNPDGSGDIPQSTPFIAVTTPTMYNGMLIPVGVYMNTAMIAEGTITHAMIGLAEIDTLRIAGNAVTQPVVVVQDAYQSVVTNGDSSVFTPVGQPLIVDMGTLSSGTMSVLVMVSFLPVNFSGGGWSSAFRVVNEVTGSVVFSGTTGTGNNIGGTPATSFYIVNVTSGIQRFRLQVRNFGDINGDSGVRDVRLFALGAKR